MDAEKADVGRARSASPEDAVARPARAAANGIAGTLRLDALERRVEHAGVSVTLSKTAFALMQRLLASPGAVVPAHAFAADLRDVPDGATPPDARIASAIASLRRRISVAGLTVHNVRGLGYCLARVSPVTVEPQRLPR